MTCSRWRRSRFRAGRGRRLQPRRPLVATAGTEVEPGEAIRTWTGSGAESSASTRPEPLSTESHHEGPAQSVAFDRHGGWSWPAATATAITPTCPDRWSLIDRQKTGDEECEHPSIRALFSPDGNVVVSGGIDGIGRVHDPATGRLIATLVGHAQPITALDFSHDGTRLVTASGDRTARIWNPASWLGSRAGESAPSWSSQVTLVGHKSWLLGAEFSPDGTLVLTCGYDRTARVWDAQTGECLVTQIGHDGTVNTARFRSRGFLMATAGSDRTARLWTTGNVETVRLVLTKHEAAIRDVEFSPREDARYLALTAGADGVASLWDGSHYDRPGVRDPSAASCPTAQAA